MKQFLHFSSKYTCLLIVTLVVLAGYSALGQTPGLILKPISGGGKTVLDPDGDGYVSAPTWGVQLGFQNDDVTESEVQYVPLVRPDPQGDLSSGATGGFTDIVGTNLDGNNAVLTYLKDDNLYFRIRLSSYASNSKAYSVLVDTDQKFGFTGPNADPNAKPGNPGFELEIVLRTNFYVDVHHIDNSDKAGPAVNSYTYESYCQKSVALSRNGADPDYFYDFYLPIPSLIKNSAGVRYVVVSSMSPSAVTGSTNLSDVSGVGVEGTTGNLDQVFAGLINTQTPTAPGQPVLTRSDCPTIDPVTTSVNAITGTTTEAAGTIITVSVYDGTTLKGSSTVTTTGTVWSVNVSALIPSLTTLPSGFKVRATAKAPGEGVSNDNCDIETVTNCTTQTTSAGVTITKVSGEKGFSLVVNKPVGTTIKCYDANYNLIDPVALNLAAPGNLNTVVTTTNPQTVNFTCQTGNCFINGVYYFTYQSPGECVSTYIASCLYSIEGASVTPTITTTPISITTTSITGTCASSVTPGTYVELFVNGNFLSGQWVVNSTSYTFNGLDLSSYACASLTVKSADYISGKTSGYKCSTESASRTIQRKALAPLIYSTGCAMTAPTSISGNSSEIGATIELFKTSGTTNTLIGSTTVPPSGLWTVPITSSSLVSGDNIKARVKTGVCLVESDFSNQVKISTQTDISGYAITITTPTEKQDYVSGTILGGSYPVTLNVYVDQVRVGSGTIIDSPGGSWTVSGLKTYDLALGSKVQVALTQGTTGCESALSTVSATVQCNSPAERTITAGNSTVCANSNGTIVVQLAESGVFYTPVNSDGTVAGYGGMGNDNDLTLTTYALTTNPTVLKVKASKFPLGSCDIVFNGSVTFNLNPSPPAPTAISPQNYCATGTLPTLADLLVTLPENCSVRWYKLASGGYPLALTTQVVANTTYYAESVNETTECRSNTRAAVLVQAGTPAAPIVNDTQTFCAGATVASLMATLSGPGTISWYAALSGGPALSTGLLLENGKTYYAQTSHNGCVSTRTKVDVNVNTTPTITSTTSASLCEPGTVILGATPSAGTINWYDAPTNGSLLGTGPSFTTPLISSTTTYYVDATVNGCTTAIRTPVVATVNTIPTISISSAPACTADQSSYSLGITVSGGILTSTAGTVINTNGNVWTVSNVPKGTNITLTVTHNGCTKTLSVTAPDCGCEAVTPPVSGGDKQYCSGSVIPSISATAAYGTTVDWYAAPTGGSPLSSNAFSYTPSSAGTYYAEARNISTGCKSGMRTPISITENPVPAINSIIASACSGVGFTITPVNGIDGIVPSGTTYSWSAPLGTGFTGGQAGSGAVLISGNLVNTTSTPQTATYTVTPISGSCTGVTFTLTVTVNPTAAVTSVTGTTPLGMGTTSTFTANSIVLGGGTGGWSSSNTLVATVNTTSGLVTAIAPGTSTITYTISGGCGGTVSAAMMVTVVPTTALPTVTLTSIGESGNLTFNVQLSAASSQPVTIPFTLGGTAINGTDYTITASPVTIPAGSTTATITITITEDMVVEGDETVIVTLGSPTNAVLGDVKVLTATIKDNDFNPEDDADGDGIVNTVDIDDDNDGIMDTVEGNSDTDGDGILNWFDLDSDNDGIYDILEAGGTDANFDGRVDNFVDGNGNGLTDSYDTDCNGTTLVTVRANSLNSFTGTVDTKEYAVDDNIATYASLNSYDASIDVQFQNMIASGTVVTIRMQRGESSNSDVEISQSLNDETYTNPIAINGITGTITDFTYVLKGNANYLRISRTNTKITLIYQITHPYVICNGNIGNAIPDYDSDKDGNKDRIEIDSDDDGCKDVIEAGFTDANSDGMLDGTGTNSLGFIIGNQNGYTAPANIYLTSAYDYREINPAAVGGTVSGPATICSGSGSGTLTLSGHSGVITKWQSSVSPFTTWIDIPVTSSNYSAAILTETTHFRAVVVTSACSSATSIPAVVTVLPTPRATINGTTSVCQNGASPLITFTNPQAFPVTITYNINGTSQATIDVNASSTATIEVPTSIAGVFNYNLVSVVYKTTPACSNNVSGTATVTVVASPSSEAGPDMTVCYSSGGINITSGSSATINGGIVWSSSGNGTFANATSLTLATYTPSKEDITAQGVTLTLTAYGNSSCGNVIDTKTLKIYKDGSWTGLVSNDWNTSANWACNKLPTLETNVTIASALPNYPTLSTGVAGMAKNINIAENASLTVDGNTLRIAGAISNGGTFDATKGTIEMAGSSAQTIGENVFATNTLLNLIINNEKGVTLSGALNITGVVSPSMGDFTSNGNLTLLSSPDQTALIDGVGTGNVLGDVNIQRYLQSSFGYKYISSPFQKATVAQLADEVKLTEKFPTLYRYYENNSIDSSNVTVYKSGWVKYTHADSLLIPMQGYAANLDAVKLPVTITMSGVVNNGTIRSTLFNRNRKYTKGFNLVGNPYPSPIDWNAVGWTKTNIDKAIYFFNAESTDRYTGIYTSYVNGQGTGSGDNIIPAMQGFFVHVSALYPDKATLEATNAVRSNILNPVFKSATIDPRPTMRLTAGFEISNAIEDVALVYFDPTAHAPFETEKDALKLENTDEMVPNIYTISPDSRKLSINGLSEPSDSVSFIPLGITTFRDGMINFRAEDADDLPFMQVYLADAMTGKYHDLRQSPDVRFSLPRGVYDSRFKLVFSKAPFTGSYPGLGKLFTLVRSGNRILVKVDLPDHSKGNLMVTNLLGQTIMRREVTGKQTVEINQSITTGVYVITLISGKRTESEKILMRTDYE